MNRPPRVKNFEKSMSHTVLKAMLSKWYWFFFIVVLKISTIYLVRNIIPKYEIPINVYAKESPLMLYSTIKLIVVYKSVELFLNNITDYVLRRNFYYIARSLKMFLFDKISQTKIHFLQEQGGPAIVNAFNGCFSGCVGAQNSPGMVYTISYIIPDCIMVIFIFSIILKNSRSLVIVSCFWVLVTIAIYFVVTRGADKILMNSQDAAGQVYMLLTNKVKNRQLEFFYSQDDRLMQQFEDYEDRAQKWQEKVIRRYQILGLLSNLILFLIQILGFNLYLAYLLNTKQITFVAFQDVFYANAAFCGVVANLLKNIPLAIRQYRESELFPTMLAPNIRDTTQNLQIAKNPDIVMNDVQCNYDTKSTTGVLSKFSIKIPFGSKVAIVGVPGSGKTTILNLICSLVDCTHGFIEVGGIDISQADRKSISETFSYIFSEPKLLVGSLRDNITMGNDIEDTKILTALYSLGLSKWAVSLDKDLVETAVSRDEKKIIMFLRAYLSMENTEIILADEPLSGLAEETRMKAFEMLKVASQDKTFLVAEQDFIHICDYVIFIEKKNVLFATHSELLEKNSYRSLFESNNLT